MPARPWPGLPWPGRAAGAGELVTTVTRAISVTETAALRLPRRRRAAYSVAGPGLAAAAAPTVDRDPGSRLTMTASGRQPGPQDHRLES